MEEEDIEEFRVRFRAVVVQQVALKAALLFSIFKRGMKGVYQHCKRSTFTVIWPI